LTISNKLKHLKEKEFYRNKLLLMNSLKHYLLRETKVT